MIRNWLNPQDKHRGRPRHSAGATNNQQAFGQFERLEDRRLLAWQGAFDGITLELTQILDDGDVVIDNATGAWRVTDNADSLTFVAATNIVVNMLDNTANQLDFNMDNTHGGNVELNLGDGPRDLFFFGGVLPEVANVALGNVTVNAGTGPQFVNLAPIVAGPFGPVPFRTGGNATFNLGDGFDTVYNNENFVRIGNDLNLIGVNLFRYTDFLPPPLGPLDADLMVGGNLLMDTSAESVESFLLEGGTFHDDDPDAPERSIIGGNLIYFGGDDIDHLDLNETYIQGDLIVDLGPGIPFFGDPQNVTTQLNAFRPSGDEPGYFEIDGDIFITAGDSNLGNVIELDGYHDGNMAVFNMGDRVDNIRYNLIGSQVDVMATMGEGDDVFNLDTFTGVNVLDIDFGNDPGDEFINNFGKFTFDSDITSFHFFDHLFTIGDDTMILNQLADTGDVVIDNDGDLNENPNVAWRVFTGIGGSTLTTPASNLTLNMISNTNNNVTMDLVNPVIAGLVFELGDGDRNLDFVGVSNNPLRDLEINAGSGEQNVELSVNAPLRVAGIDIDLGTGYDMVDDDANNLIITEGFELRGVNLFENDGLLSITANAVVDSSFETEDTIFANNSNMIVGGEFEYFGGDGRDEVRLNGALGTSIVRTAFIDLGDNITGGTQYALFDSALTQIGDTVRVLSTNAFSSDVIDTAAGAGFGGNLIVDLGDGSNDVNLVGDSSGGLSVQYTGGDGIDNLIFGMTGNPSALSALLGPNNDTFTFLPTASIAPEDLFVDFGGGFDTFNNLYGVFDFNATLLNLNGFNFNYNAAQETLSATEVPGSSSPVTVDNAGPGGAIRFIDGGTSILTPTTGLTVNMLDQSMTDLEIDFDATFAGDLTVHMGDSDRDLDFIGSDNTIDGDLAVTGGSGNQVVEVARNAGLNVTGNASFVLGTGSDVVDEDGNDVSVGGDLDFVGVNLFENNGLMTVGGNFSVNTAVEAQNTLFNDNASLVVLGDFNYTGGTGRDAVELNGPGGTMIGQQATIDLGDNTLSGAAQIVSLTNAAAIGGDLTVRSSNASSEDIFLSEAATTVGGNIDIDLRGGPNTAVIRGVLGGTNVKYNGTTGEDDVTFGTTGSPADVNIKLGLDDDIFTLDAGSAISPTTLRVDFGGGDDIFVNNYGAFDFNANLVRWNGYSRVYDLATDSLNITQTSDTGPLTVDNNGVGNAIRLWNGATVTENTPATNIRIVMADNTTSTIVVDLDTALPGDFVLNTHNGDRTVLFTGSSNTVNGLLRLEAADGVQEFNLAENADLNVGSSLVINGRDGSDVVDEGLNNINVAIAMLLRGINTFINNNTVTVGGDFNYITVLESENTQLVNNGSLNVGGNLSYLGGTGVDAVQLAGAGTTIGGYSYFGISSAIDALPQQISLLNGFSTTALFIDGGNSVGNHVVTDGSTSVAGDVIVNFTGSNGANSAVFMGAYGGTYATFRGGSNVDTVSFGASAPNMLFAMLSFEGDDVFTVEATADLSFLYADFGDGNDSLIDNLGQPWPFGSTILNL